MYSNQLLKKDLRKILKLFAARKRLIKRALITETVVYKTVEPLYQENSVPEKQIVSGTVERQ